MGVLIPRQKVRAPARGGIARSRLNDRVRSPGARFVAAPAGSGKTTLLAHVAESWDGRSAWFAVDPTDRDPAALVAGLSAAFGITASTVQDILAAIDDEQGPVLLVIDDVHELAGSSSAELLDILVRYRPPHCTLVFAGRHFAGVGQWRWRTGDEIDLVDANDLRFRLWEVDALFRNELGLVLEPDELQQVTHATDGWAVALTLFHLAARRSDTDRAALITAIGSDHRAIRAYLGEQVLGRVSTSERELLRRMAVFDYITAERCDRLLEVVHSAKSLDALAAAGIIDGDLAGSGFRLHALVRSHLLAELAEEIGDAALAVLHRRAAAILESEDHFGEALRSYARAGDWDDIHRLAGGGAGLDPEMWPEAAEHAASGDPWAQRAEGLGHIALGHYREAAECLTSARDLFDAEGGNPRNSRDLRLLGDWLAPPPGPPTSWSGRLRRGLEGTDTGPWGDSDMSRSARGIVELAHGRLHAADELFADTKHDATAAILSGLGRAAIAVLSGDETGALAHAEHAVELARAGSLRTAEAVAEGISATVLADGEPTPLIDLCRKRGDVVSEAVLCLLAGATDPRTGHGGAGHLLRAGECFRRLGLTVPARLADLLLESVSSDPTPIRHTEAAARSAGPLAHALWLAASVRREPEAVGATAAARQAVRLADRHGFTTLLDATATLDLRGRPPHDNRDRVVPPSPSGDESAAPGSLTCSVLGTFRLTRDGREIDLGPLRPRHRELLMVLASQCGAWVHRDRIGAWLWPDAPPERLRRAIQTAVSAIRGVIDGDGDETAVERSAERYRLVAASDLRDAQYRLATLAGVEGDGAIELLGDFIEQWTGELLPGAGSPEWAVALRYDLNRSIEDATSDAVRLLREATEVQPEHVIALGRLAEIIRDSDLVWQSAIEVAERAEQPALARRLTDNYAAFADLRT